MMIEGIFVTMLMLIQLLLVVLLQHVFYNVTNKMTYSLIIFLITIFEKKKKCDE